MKEGHDPSDLHFKNISGCHVGKKSRVNKGEAGRLDRKLVSAQAEDYHRRRGAAPCLAVGPMNMAGSWVGRDNRKGDKTLGF